MEIKSLVIAILVFSEYTFLSYKNFLKKYCLLVSLIVHRLYLIAILNKDDDVTPVPSFRLSVPFCSNLILLDGNLEGSLSLVM